MEEKKIPQKVLLKQQSSLSGKSRLPGGGLFGLEIRAFPKLIGMFLFFILLGTANANAADVKLEVDSGVKPVAGKPIPSKGQTQDGTAAWEALWFRLTEDPTAAGIPVDTLLPFDTLTVYAVDITFKPYGSNVLEIKDGDSLTVGSEKYPILFSKGSDTIVVQFLVTERRVPQYKGDGIVLERPVVGGSPSISVKDVSGVAAGEITRWEPPLPKDGKFDAGKKYTATIKLTAAEGFTFYQTGGNDWFKVTADSIKETKHTLNSDSIEVTFKETTPRIDLDLYKDYNLRVPVAGDSVNNDTIQAKSTKKIGVKWYETGGESKVDLLNTGKVYVARFSLGGNDVQPGYTLYGITDSTNSFEFSGATVDSIIYADSVVNVYFQETARTIDIYYPDSSVIKAWENAIGAATPIAGRQAVLLDTLAPSNETFEITGGEWKATKGAGLDKDGRFVAGSVYKAFLTLKPKPGYTTYGVDTVGATFPIAGHTITIEAVERDSAIFSATYDATAANPTMKEAFSITRPAPGKAAQDTVTVADGNSYKVSKKIDWKPSKPTKDSFLLDSTYTASFDIEIQGGDSTLYGLTSSFYTFTGADSVELTVYPDSATKGRLTVTYKTEKTIPFDFDIKKPVAGGTPQAGVAEKTSVYKKADITWTGVSGAVGKVFGADTIYQAKFALKPEAGKYTLYGLNADTVAAKNGGDSAKIDLTDNTIAIYYPKTAPTISISKENPLNVYPTENQAAPDTVIGKDYTGNIVWTYVGPEYTPDTLSAGEPFVKGRAYTAKFTLTADSVHTLYGLTIDTTKIQTRVDGWSAADSVSHTPNSGTVIVIYKPTEAAPKPANRKNAFALFGGFPVAGKDQAIYDTVKVVDGTAGFEIVNKYNGSDDSTKLRWRPYEDITQKFGADTSYYVEFWVTAQPGYTLGDLTTGDFFEIKGATVTNKVPATEKDTIWVKATVKTAPLITDSTLNIIPPKAGEYPQSKLTATTELQEAGITWTDADGATVGIGSVFLPGTVYKANLTVKHKPEYTFYGLPEDFFAAVADTVSNEAVGDAADSVDVRIVFGATSKSITHTNIVIEAPEAGATAQLSVQDPAVVADSVQWKASVAWTPEPAGNTFAPGVVYTAVFTFTGENGYSNILSPALNFTVNDQDGAYVSSPNSVTYIFPKTVTGIATLQGNGLRVAGSGGILKIKGLTIGEPISIYNLQGVLVSRRTALSGEQEIVLPAGIYIIVTSKERVKALHK